MTALQAARERLEAYVDSVMRDPDSLRPERLGARLDAVIFHLRRLEDEITTAVRRETSPF